MKSSSVTSWGSHHDDPPRGLRDRVAQAFDILAGSEAGLGLAVSGGSDSTALLVLGADWACSHGKRIEVATVDHGLRPEAAEEAEKVAGLCRTLGVAHTTLVWRREGTGAVSQAEARRGRHALLADWLREKDLKTLALGHTRDDRVETFLMRVRQGSGWRGLAGPLPSAPSPVWPEGRGLRLVRPLLAFGREELREDLQVRNLKWVDDPSNEAERFERVRMRALVQRLDAASSAQALRVMDGMARMRAAVAAEARAGMAAVEFDAEASMAQVPLKTLQALGAEARLRLMEALLMAAGGKEAAPRTEALKRLAAWMERGAGPAGGLTLGGAWIRLENDQVTFTEAPVRRGEAAGKGPAWDRAADLLSDPMLAALVP